MTISLRANINGGIEGGFMNDEDELLFGVYDEVPVYDNEWSGAVAVIQGNAYGS